MTSRRLLAMLFSVSVVLIVFAGLLIAAEPESNAAQDRIQAASCQRCGDGYCAPRCENEFTCPADCRSTKLAAPAPAPAAAPAVATNAARCGRCGDGQCVKSCGETAQSCPVDCGGVGEPSAAKSSVQTNCPQEN